MLNISQKEITKELKTIKRVFKYQIQGTYPFNDLDDRPFELLVYQLADQNKKSKSFLEGVTYDNCGLMAGVREKGRDIILSKKSSIVGVIQCKKYQNNITKSQMLKELIKFLCFYLEDKSLIPNIKTFTYIFAVSKGLSNEAMEYIHNRKHIPQNELEKIIKGCLVENKGLTLSYSDSIKSEITKLLKSMRIKTLLPTELTSSLKNNPTIICTFFEVDRVIDRQTFEEIIYGSDLDIDTFLDDYGRSILNNHSRINFFGIALPRRPREVQLYSLFIEPTFKMRDGTNIVTSFQNTKMNKLERHLEELLPIVKKSETIEPKDFKGSFTSLIFGKLIEDWDKETNNNHYKNIFEKKDNNWIRFENVFNSSNHIVLLGRPGAGKSSLVKYALCKLADRDETVFRDKSIYSKIPFRIELNQYNRAKVQSSQGIIEYLSNLLENEYQLHYVSKKAVTDLFTNYKTIFFFDGLDEVLDVQERIQIRNDIENFLNMYPDTQGIVTSRYESYDEVYFNKSQFNVLEVNNFDDEQIKRYVGQWYKIEEEDPTNREYEIKKCLEELTKIENELKTNPLLLTLILILYRNELELPTSKLSLYESCTKTLVETRDFKEKKLNIVLKISNIIATFSSLAYWQYVNIDAKGFNVTYDNAQKHVKNYLLKKGEFEYENEAALAAEEFLEFARLRSIYVENNFTHKTFLEYLTAYYIYTNFHAKGKHGERDKIIKKYIGNASWNVILELLICKIDEDQGDYEIIDGIINHYSNNSKEIYFMLQIIKYLRNISPKMIQTLFRKTLNILILEYGKNSYSIIKLINDQLNILSELEKYKTIYHIIVNEMVQNLRTDQDNHNYFLFLMENGIHSSHLSKDSEQFCKVIEKEPLAFILLNLNRMLLEEQYYETLETFLEMYGVYNTIKNYKPQFSSSAVFNGYNRFNWITTGLFSDVGYNDFVKKIIRLNKLGINHKTIKRAILQDNGEINLKKEDLEDYLNQKPNEPIKNIIYAALKKYYNVSRSADINQPYYKLRNRPKSYS